MNLRRVISEMESYNILTMATINREVEGEAKSGLEMNDPN